MPLRTRLPNRRPSHFETLEVGAQVVTACIGFDPATSRPRDVLAFDAGLLALLANVQNALAAVEEIVEVERPPANQASEVSPSSGANAPTTP